MRTPFLTLILQSDTEKWGLVKKILVLCDAIPVLLKFIFSWQCSEKACRAMMVKFSST